MSTRSHSRPSYRDDRDPPRRLLAAVVLQAVRDCFPERKISSRDRESAQYFLSGEEGEGWLQAFGIPAGKAREFTEIGN